MRNFPHPYLSTPEALHKKCLYTKLFWSVFSHIRTECGEILLFGLNMERYSVSLRVQSECGKMWTRVTPNPDSLNEVSVSVFLL